MDYRAPTAADITSLLQIHGCSEKVIYNAIRAIDLLEILLKPRSFDKVMSTYLNEFQFIENHVLQDEILFVDFYNGLLDRLIVREHGRQVMVHDSD